MNLNKDKVQYNYLNILELLEKEPGGEQALSSLIELENSIKKTVFNILENYKVQGIDVKQTQINKAINGRITELRNQLEARIIQIITGNKVNISDLIDQMIARINEMLKNNKNIEDMTKQMRIEFHNIKETILPPDEKEIYIGHGNGTIEKKKGYNKFGLLVYLLRKNGVYTDDFFVVKGQNQANQMRKSSYLYIHIPRINKTILLNNDYGEKTFIYDGYVELEYFVKSTKNVLNMNEKVDGISFNYENPNNWKERMEYFLFQKIVVDNLKTKIIGEKVDIKKFLKAPKGWKTNKSLCKELGVDQGTTKRIADKYRKTNPEWFKQYLNIQNRLFEHYSPELCSKIEEQLENQGEKAPKGWITNTPLSDLYKVDKGTTKRIADKYRKTNPEWFKQYLDKSRRPAEHYSPELCSKIKEQLENQGEKAPKGWKTNSNIHKELGVSQSTTKRIADKYRKTNPEGFKQYLNIQNRLFEHYSPELCEKIKEIFFK